MSEGERGAGVDENDVTVEEKGQKVPAMGVEVGVGGNVDDEEKLAAGNGDSAGNAVSSGGGGGLQELARAASDRFTQRVSRTVTLVVSTVDSAMPGVATASAVLLVPLCVALLLQLALRDWSVVAMGLPIGLRYFYAHYDEMWTLTFMVFVYALGYGIVSAVTWEVLLEETGNKLTILALVVGMLLLPFACSWLVIPDPRFHATKPIVHKSQLVRNMGLLLVASSISFGQLAFSFSFGALFANLETTTQRVIACALYPCIVAPIKQLSHSFASLTSYEFAASIEFDSLIFAALPYRLLFIELDSYAELFAILAVEISYKVFTYVIIYLPAWTEATEDCCQVHLLTPRTVGKIVRAWVSNNNSTATRTTPSPPGSDRRPSGKGEPDFEEFQSAKAAVTPAHAVQQHKSEAPQLQWADKGNASHDRNIDAEDDNGDEGDVSGASDQGEVEARSAGAVQPAKQQELEPGQSTGAHKYDDALPPTDPVVLQIELTEKLVFQQLFDAALIAIVFIMLGFARRFRVPQIDAISDLSQEEFFYLMQLFGIGLVVELALSVVLVELRKAYVPHAPHNHWDAGKGGLAAHAVQHAVSALVLYMFAMYMLHTV